MWADIKNVDGAKGIPKLMSIESLFEQTQWKRLYDAVIRLSGFLCGIDQEH